MSADLPEVKIVRHTVDRDRSDPARVAITFIVSSLDATAARTYAASDQLVEKGISICEQLPLMQVGLDQRGIPCYCDETGRLKDLGFVENDPDKKVDHYYAVTYSYIGSR